MNQYQVHITDTAYADMEKLYEHIAYVLMSPGNALNQYNRIADAILTLAFLPERHSLFEEEPEKTLGIHKMIVDNYVICYVIDPAVVTVTDIIYGASDLHSKLKQRHSSLS